jgi:hypothetical protein
MGGSVATSTAPVLAVANARRGTVSRRRLAANLRAGRGSVQRLVDVNKVR